MSGNLLPLGIGNASVPRGTHIAFPYKEEHERASFLFAYLKAGLENGEKCVAAVIEYTRDYWLDSLSSLGIDVEPLIGNQLVIFDTADISSRLHWDNRTESMLIRRMAAVADQEGYAGLRVCTSMTPFLQWRDALPYMLQAEAENEHMPEDGKALLVCTFGERRLNKGVMDLCLRTHAFVLDSTGLHSNSAFLGPSEYRHYLPERLQELSDAGALDPPFAGLDFSEGIPVLRITGEIDVFTAPQLEELGASLSEVGQRCFVVDLSRAPFLDAAAVSAILRLNNIAHEKSGRLAIYDPKTPLRTIFRLIHLDAVIPVMHDFQEALTAVQQ